MDLYEELMRKNLTPEEEELDKAASEFVEAFGFEPQIPMEDSFGIEELTNALRDAVSKKDAGVFTR